MFAVIKSGGRQYKVSVGQTLEVNRLPVEDGEQVHFDEVLLISDANITMVGTPLVDNATVLATATKQGRGEKLIVFRYKPKKRIRHRKGHRQELTILTIDDIVAGGKSLITGAAPESRKEEEEVLPVAAEAETSVESAQLEAPTGEVNETTESEVEEKKPSRRRRTKKTEESESEAEE
ncbi:MAG TPA: 50S ribosomal protein L21 [Ktedonobacteraceae bacterium]|nr:50S ribosomal protein L21 [Ktedonobacteraceae bacterium]